MRLNLLVVLMIMVLCLFQYRLWFESGGARDVVQLREKLAAQMRDNEKLKQHNEALLFQVKRLQNSEDAAESRARNELGMIKGETFYQILKPSPYAESNRKNSVNHLKQLPKETS